MGRCAILYGVVGSFPGGVSRLERLFFLCIYLLTVQKVLVLRLFVAAGTKLPHLAQECSLAPSVACLCHSIIFAIISRKYRHKNKMKEAGLEK